MFKAALITLVLITPAAAQQKGVVLYGMNQPFPEQSNEQELCDFYDQKDSRGKRKEIMRCYCYGESSDKDILKDIRKGS